MNILIVKLSSLGDVLHNLPIVWDIRQHYPNAKIDWVVEEAYVSLLQPLLSKPNQAGIDRIIPIALRRWKKSLLKLNTYVEISEFKRHLQSVRYDVIIDTQGLIKSAFLLRLAHRNKNAVLAGLANATEGSGYEPMARWFYNLCVSVPEHCHAVERSRLVTYAAMNLPPPNPTILPQFYPADFKPSGQTIYSSDALKPYILFFHATARSSKRWSEQNWVMVGKQLAEAGFSVVLPWGSSSEKIISQRIASQIDHAVVPDAFTLAQSFSIIAGARLTIGVDTGLTHLSAVLNKPTIELYCDSPRWKTEGYWSSNIVNLGNTGNPPAVHEVLAHIQNWSVQDLISSN